MASPTYSVPSLHFYKRTKIANLFHKMHIQWMIYESVMHTESTQNIAAAETVYQICNFFQSWYTKCTSLFKLQLFTICFYINILQTCLFVFKVTYKNIDLPFCFIITQLDRLRIFIFFCIKHPMDIFLSRLESCGMKMYFLMDSSKSFSMFFFFFLNILLHFFNVNSGI